MKQRSDDKRRKRREIGRTARTHRADMGAAMLRPYMNLPTRGASAWMPGPAFRGVPKRELAATNDVRSQVTAAKLNSSGRMPAHASC
jgi:hypothetical protein